MANPYKTLGVEKEATDDEIKNAYRKKAMSTHPDRNPDKGEEAQKQFTDVGEAYEILKDKDKRQEYDLHGSVGGGGQQAWPGQHPHPSQADWQRHIWEFQQQQSMRQQPPTPPPKPKGVLEEDMEVWIRHDVLAIHLSSRKSNIGTKNDGVRASFAGKMGTIAELDPKDQAVKVRVMVSAGRAAQVWFSAGAVWDPLSVEKNLAVKIGEDTDTILRASRESHIGTANDERRARCAGKTGTVVDVDRKDGAAKVRVMLTATTADELWFGYGALELLKIHTVAKPEDKQQQQQQQQQQNPFGGFGFRRG